MTPQTSDTPLVDHYTAADEVATLTPLTDAVRFRLHASFCDWPEEAQEAIELYDDFARSLERSLAKANADREVLREALEGMCQLAERLDNKQVQPTCSPAYRVARAALDHMQKRTGNVDL
jgi:hypothetical protein